MVTTVSVPLPEPFQRHRLTIGDYHRMGEAGILTEDSRVELIEGALIDMAPIGSPHAGMVKRLNRIFDRAVGSQAIVSVQDPVLLGQYSEPQPDIALLRPRDDFYAKSHPHPKDVLLIVEVADSSLRYDREVKIPLYARHGIPEVWLVDVEKKQLTVFHTPAQQAYREEIQPETAGIFQLTCLPEIKIDLSGLF
jgi:Uma2 family endonuclease